MRTSFTNGVSGKFSACSGSRAGSTLIEVVTAVTIFGVVMTGVFATFSFQKQSYTTQNNVAAMQQSLRLATDLLARDIRMAGYGLNSDVNVPATSVGGSSGNIALRGIYDSDGGGTGPDEIYIFYMYDMDNTVTALQPTLSTSQVTAGNSGLTVNVTAGTGTRFAAGDLAVINSSTTADMYEVTSAADNSVTFGNSSTFNTTGHSAGNVYDAGSKVSLARFMRYFIDNTTDTAHPTLMMQRIPGGASQPVADDIEDLQVSYGLAAAVDNALVSTTVDSPTDAELLRVRRATISLVARSRMKERGWQGRRPNIGNRTGTAPADEYRRRIMNGMAVDVRNTRLN